jgi:hypothetical protein
LRFHTFFIVLWLVGLCSPAIMSAQAGDDLVRSITINKEVRVPRVSRPPTLQDFLSMKPSPDFADGKMAMIDKLIQRSPSDGQPVSERTEVYLGFDKKNFYVVFVCFDSDPKAIRAHLARREDAWGDENAEIMLDTFNDHLHAYGFLSNPLGIQTDGIYSEGSDWDMSYDTLWYSNGKLTPEGYVVSMTIPFRSLRFPNKAEQSWGLILDRDIPRKSEEAYWPEYTRKIEGRLNQEGTMTGLENISPGRNIQFIPYGSFSSYRAPDYRDAAAPRFSSKAFKGDLGLDSKIVLKDSFVFDSTINPDFSQVESDEPQVTTNQRFEVYFPEKRPFFLENAAYFQTPIRLVFTRRIADPNYGVRLTGKKGPTSIGVLFADDSSPGKSVPENDPLKGTTAKFVIARASFDLPNQSMIGALFTDREYQNEYNRVAGLDTRLKFNKFWVFTGQAVASSTKYWDGSYYAGPTFSAELSRTGQFLSYYGSFNDTGAGFYTESGFFRRPNYRTTYQQVSYTFRPNNKWLISHGPRATYSHGWDHDGTTLDSWQAVNYSVQLQHQTEFQAGTGFGTEGLRPVDFASLPQYTQYSETDSFIYGETQAWQKVGFSAQLSRAKSVNYNGVGINVPPPLGNVPRLGTEKRADVTATIRPVNPMRIDLTYLYRRLEDPPTEMSAYNLHIVRSKFNYQLTKELSLRFIAQYNAQLSNPLLSTLPTDKNFNADFLLTYLLHPGTALYVGYNSNLANLDPALRLDPAGNVLRTNRFINDGRQFFVKISYLFRY